MSGGIFCKNWQQCHFLQKMTAKKFIAKSDSRVNIRWNFLQKLTSESFVTKSDSRVNVRWIFCKNWRQRNFLQKVTAKKLFAKIDSLFIFCNNWQQGTFSQKLTEVSFLQKLTGIWIFHLAFTLANSLKSKTANVVLSFSLLGLIGQLTRKQDNKCSALSFSVWSHWPTHSEARQQM